MSRYDDREISSAPLDEERRLASHEDVKAEIDSDVNSQIKQHARRVEPVEQAELAGVARELKQRSVNEALHTERQIGRSKTAARISQVVDYIFYLIYGIITLQFLLRLMGARRGNDFVQLVETISSPLLGPFEGIVANPTVGSMQIALSYLVALIVYILVHMAINGALRLIANRRVAV